MPERLSTEMPNGPYFLSLEGDRGSTYIYEPVENVMRHLYQTLDPSWNNAMNHWNELVLGAVATSAIAHSELYKSPEVNKNQIAFGLLGGSGGSRFIRNTDETLKIAGSLKKSLIAAEQEDSFNKMDPLYQQAFSWKHMNPYDLDYKVFWDGTPHDFFRVLNKQLDNHISIASYQNTHSNDTYHWSIGFFDKRKYHLQSRFFEIDNGLPIISMTLDPVENSISPYTTHTPFTIQITTLTPNEIKPFCYRSGPHIGSKQTESEGLPAPLLVANWRDEFEYSYYVAMEKELYQKAQETLNGKTLIQNPSFTSLPQALTVGMRAIYAEHIYTGQCKYDTRSSSHYEQETIDAYSAELARVYAEFLHSDTPVDAYRAQEVIRAAVICMESDWVNMLNEGQDMGIFDVFIKDFIAASNSKCEYDEPQWRNFLALTMLTYVHAGYSASVAFAKALEVHGYEFTQENDWGKFAEIFDIRKLREHKNCKKSALPTQLQ